MEEFFLLSCQVDEVKLLDLVLRRYHSLDCMKVLDVGKFCKLMLLALDDEVKEIYRREWLSLLPVMVFTQHYMTFNEYFDISTGRNIDMRPVDEIMAEIERKHAEARGDNE